MDKAESTKPEFLTIKQLGELADKYTDLEQSKRPMCSHCKYRSVIARSNAIERVAYQWICLFHGTIRDFTADEEALLRLGGYDALEAAMGYGH